MILFHLDINPEIELLDYMIVLCLTSWETFALFSTMATPLYIPTRVQGLPFLHCLPAFIFFIKKTS